AALLDADLSGANLTGTDLSEAVLNRSRLIGANLSAATLRDADLQDATLRGANLSGANLQGANLRYTVLADADLSGADLTGCAIYGVSAWNTRLHGAIQARLDLTDSPAPGHPVSQPAITVGHLAAAQLLHLLSQNAYTPAVHSALSRHIVLILGRFPPERQQTLQAIRHDLWERNYVPVFVDVLALEEQAHAGLIDVLIGMASGVLVDLSDAPYAEVMFPRRPIPVQPVLVEGQVAREVFPLFYHQLLPLSRYESTEGLRRCLAVFLDRLSTATH
ncbi:MAG TPA: pentapeptide repeat-containing protein, partial [Ktedonobacteraceae bacterium]|nr:pentapeptide repeat-containing protein [Ktedonobacteraceae bacterium]